MAQEALSGPPRNHGAVAGLGTIGARLQRSRTAGLLVPRTVVRAARPLDHDQDDSRSTWPARGVLAKPGVRPWRARLGRMRGPVGGGPMQLAPAAQVPPAERERP